MGNSFVIADNSESAPVDDSVAFFRTLQVKWLRHLCDELRETTNTKFSIDDKSSLFSWRDYFRIFSDIKKGIEVEKMAQQDAQWHMSTLGYLMIQEDIPDEVKIVEEAGIPDDYTEDEPSDSDEYTDSEDEESDEDDENKEGSLKSNDENVNKSSKSSNIGSDVGNSEKSSEPDEESKDEDDDESKDSQVSTSEKAKSTSSNKSRKSGSSKSGSYSEDDSSSTTSVTEKAPPKKSWDSNFVSPIFFGYNRSTKAEAEQKVRDAQNKVMAAENRAVEKAKAHRIAEIQNFHTQIEKQSKARETNIDSVTKKYENSQTRRVEDLNRNQKIMTEMAFKMYKTEWEATGESATEAFEIEITQLRQIHATKSAFDDECYEKKKEELEAFKDADAQEMPAAERLEEIARLEMCRMIDVLDVHYKEMEAIRLDYQEIKDELLQMEEAKATPIVATAAGKKAAGNAKANSAASINQLRSMVNVSETRVRTKKKELEEQLSFLADTELLLARSVRIKKQQDEILPLFRLISQTARPSSVRLDLFMSAVTLLSSCTYDQKFEFFMNLYDTNQNGYFNSKFLCDVIETFQETFVRLEFTNTRPNMEEIINYIRRAFMSLNLALTDDVTFYEGKQILTQTYSHNALICECFGVVDLQGNMCNFQRVKMHAVSLYTRGMIDKDTCFYRLHYERQRYRPQLNPENKQTIHELALSMGEDDPLRADYTKFIVKKSKKKAAAIPPLEHGHCSNVNFIEHRDRSAAALKIQSLFRAIHEREIAELAAKYQAFLDAKEMALKEMRDRIVREFRKREAGTGVGKMKWDAQVRMRQAKERATNRAMSRSDVVMLMMEEAISNAKNEIEDRFAEIEKAEDFKGINFEKRNKAEEAPKDDGLNLNKLFGLNEKVEDTSLLGSEIKIETPRAEQVQDAADPDVESADCNTITAARAQLTIQGQYWVDLEAKGETLMEVELRHAMMSSVPDATSYYGRLRSLNSVITEYKGQEILGEIPSKRLLVQMMEFLPLQQLKDMLKSYYRLPRNVDEIATYLKAIVQSDLERGILIHDMVDIQQICENGLQNFVKQDMQLPMRDLNQLIDSRLNSGNMSEEMLLHQEQDRINTMYNRYTEHSASLYESICTMQEKFRKVLISVEEVARKQRVLDLTKEVRSGRESDDLIKASRPERQSWILRLAAAVKLSATKEATKVDRRASKRVGSSVDLGRVGSTASLNLEASLSLEGGNMTALDEGEADDAAMAVNIHKYAEIKSICEEFLITAEADAQTIMKEYFLSKPQKTIRVTSEVQVDGRFNVVGRGMGNGHTWRFEAHNIVYQVVMDDDGVCNGSDEMMMKTAGNSRLGSLEYFKCHIPSMNVPLMATIDLYGFRILATAKLPTELKTFNDEGELRKVREEMVHGVSPKGDSFTVSNKTNIKLLKAVSNILNLAPHQVRGMKDVAIQKTTASADIKGYVARGEFYYNNFWRSFPAESPEATPHFASVSRDQSVFWRQLRPEFVKNYPNGALSPDAYCLLTYGVPDQNEHIQNSIAATKYLMTKTVPAFLEILCARSFTLPVSQGLGLDITTEMHSRGINMRHLGVMRNMLWKNLPGTFGVYYWESKIRTSRDLRDEVKDGDRIKVNDIIYTVAETDKHKITGTKIPIKEVLKCQSQNGAVASHGNLLSSVENCDAEIADIRSVLLAEMVSRTVKNIIRLQLRNYAKSSGVVSHFFQNQLLCEYFNVITGSNHKSRETFEDVIYYGIRERFGHHAIKSSERFYLAPKIMPSIVYIIKRLQNMLGVHLSVSCIGEFTDRPVGFCFCSTDFLEVMPIVRHNMPLMAFSEAQLVLLSAQQAEKDTYVASVLYDHPSAFYTLYERKGSRVAENKGSLSKLQAGGKPAAGGGVGSGLIYSVGVELELPGPIVTDSFSRAARFNYKVSSKLDGKFHAQIVPQSPVEHFAVEVFALVERAKEEFRTVLMSGRYAIMVNRQGWWTVLLMEGMYEVYVKVSPVAYNEWTHVVVTFDGTTLRVYVNAVMMVAVETEAPMTRHKNEFANDMKEKHDDLNLRENFDRDSMKQITEEESDKYFISKQGISEMKKAAGAILENMQFLAENNDDGGEKVRENRAALKAKKQAAMTQAKQAYVQELYVGKVKAVAEKYRILRDELTDRAHKEVEDGLVRMRKPLRVGASCSGADSSEAKNFFVGCISCVSVYNQCLMADRVQHHFLCSRTDKSRDAQRLYGVASSKFNEALHFAPDDIDVLRGYALALCEYLKVELNGASRHGVSVGKLKILDAIDEFINVGNPDGMAEIMKALPAESEYANLVCAAFRGILKVNKAFFAVSRHISRKDLVHVNHQFALANPSNSRYYLETAAMIYQEVLYDGTLSYVYGSTNMGWVSSLKCPELIVALVSHAQENANLHMVKVGEIFNSSSSAKTKITITDKDVEILACHLTLSYGFDFTGCSLITHESIRYISRLRGLRIVNLDGCTMLDNASLQYLLTVSDQLEVISLDGVTKVDDDGLTPLATNCHMLSVLNVSNCPNVTFIALVLFCKNNRRLNTLHAAATYITDAGFVEICNQFIVSGKHLTSLDISFCREIGDAGVVALSQTCPNLKSINICSLSRVTAKGIQSLLNKCWYLRVLNVEDIFLMRDRVFWYDIDYDGRLVTDENMMMKLEIINLRDCVNITDYGIHGITKRCKKVDTLVLRGCDKITDKCFDHMVEIPVPFDDEGHELFCFCDSLKSLDLSFCSGLTATGMLTAIPKCGCLEEVNLNGMYTVDDAVVHSICKLCPTLLKLHLQRCSFITDAALCSLADYLWLEMLDISYCTKLTDDGIEILSVACTGITKLYMRRVTKLTSRTVHALSRNSSMLADLDVRECPLILEDPQCLKDIQHQLQYVHVVSEMNPE